ncbi:MAG TPA: TonB family protein [Terriglobia bacterium]|nr:TonB family protein [Terriglobia bacterium]
MRRNAFVLAFVFAIPALLPAKDPKWIEVSSDHFLLFTDTNEMKGRRLVSDFENRVAAFSEAFGKVPPRQFPIEIFLFNQEPDFIEILPRVQGQQAENQLRKNAYLLRGPDRIFIVAKDKSPDDIANDVGHALGHVLFERYVVWRPFWLAEGAAELVRKIGRSADTKPITEQEGFTAADMFTIVPSATYNDSDPPTPFRTEAYRLLRFVLEQKPDVLRQYLQALRAESDKAPTISIDGAAIQAQFTSYVETPLKPPAVTAGVKSADADMSKLAIHRGDLLVAADRQSEAARWYNADSGEARAARAIITRFSRQPVEAIRVLDRAARELPDNGLVQYHLGAMEAPDKKDIPSQTAALERAVQLLPMMGRAFAELARMYALTGQGEKSLPLIAKAIDLEPEYADHFYDIRADAHLALDQSAQALRDINIASDLPHFDRSSAIEHFNLKRADVRKRIEMARREVDLRELEALRKELRAEAEVREPPPTPAPPPPPVPAGSISYQIETRAPIEVVDSIFPDYPETLRKKGTAGTISLQVDIGPDGKVKTASITNSQLQDLNKATLDAVKKWSFKPGNRSIRLILKFALQ